MLVAKRGYLLDNVFSNDLMIALNKDMTVSNLENFVVYGFPGGKLNTAQRQTVQMYCGGIFTGITKPQARGC